MSGERAVFLDAGRDRYFCLGKGLEATFRGLLDGAPASDGGLTDLERLNIIEPGRAGGRAIRPPEPAQIWRSLIEEEAPLSGWRAAVFAEVTLNLAKARFRLRGQRFGQILEHLRARKNDREPAETPGPCEVEAWVSSYNAARRLVPLKPVCLQDSLGLLDYLAARRAFPDLVFGVKLAPFAAHCWVQANGVVLNETIDTASAYTPILVV